MASGIYWKINELDNDDRIPPSWWQTGGHGGYTRMSRQPSPRFDQRLRVVLRPCDQIQTAPASCSYQVLKLLPWDQQGIREVVGHWRSDYTWYHGLEDDSRVLVPNLETQYMGCCLLTLPIFSTIMKDIF